MDVPNKCRMQLCVYKYQWYCVFRTLVHSVQQLTQFWMSITTKVWSMYETIVHLS